MTARKLWNFEIRQGLSASYSLTTCNYESSTVRLNSIHSILKSLMNNNETKRIIEALFSFQLC